MPYTTPILRSFTESNHTPETGWQSLRKFIRNLKEYGVGEADEWTVGTTHAVAITIHALVPHRAGYRIVVKRERGSESVYFSIRKNEEPRTSHTVTISTITETLRDLLVEHLTRENVTL